MMPADLNQSYRIDPADLPGEAVIFGSTPAMREIRSKIDCVLSSDLPVLIRGKSGTGKEVIARFLHTRSNRHDAPFVKLSCAAIPASLLESELFGCERGARDGAEEDRLGLIEVADGGTLFLDEIADMSWSCRESCSGCCRMVLLAALAAAKSGADAFESSVQRILTSRKQSIPAPFAKTSSIALRWSPCICRPCATAETISPSFASTCFGNCPVNSGGASRS